MENPPQQPGPESQKPSQPPSPPPNEPPKPPPKAAPSNPSPPEQQKPPTPPPTPAPPDGPEMPKVSTLAPIGEYFRKAWAIYKKRGGTLVGIQAVGFLLEAVAFLLSAAFIWLAISTDLPMASVIVGVAIAMSLVLVILILAWAGNAFYLAVVDDTINVKSAFLQAKDTTTSFCWLVILSQFFIIGGTFLFVIPGLMFLIWFFFAPFLFVTDKARGFSSLQKSRAHVKGQFWPVGIRLFEAWLPSFFFGLVPVIGQILAFLYNPLIFVLAFLVFKDLKSLQQGKLAEPSRVETASVMATGIVGYVLVPLALFALVGTFVAKGIKNLKAQLTGGETAIVIPQTPPPAMTPPPPQPPKPPRPSSPIPATPQPATAKPPQKTVVTTPKPTPPPAAAKKPAPPPPAKKAVPPQKLPAADPTPKPVAAPPKEEKKEPLPYQTLVDMLKDKDWKTRRDAAESLSVVGDKRHIPYLKKLLRDQWLEVQDAARNAIAEIQKK